MKLQILAVWDTASAHYENPWVAPTTQAAIRAFGDAIKDPNSPFGKHPADYQLHHIGELDTETGKIRQSDEQHRLCIARAQDLIEQNP